MKKTSYKILIADDHQIFIDGLMMIFADVENIELIHVATNGQEALDIFEKNEIDLAILDVNMPKPNGFELCQIILEKYKNTKIMILSMYGDENFMKEFTRMGVMAYVLKNAGKHELLDAVEHVLNGELYISKALRNKEELVEDDFVKSLSLTKREKEIISLLAKEKSSQEIADALFISIYTVNTHRKNILHKLGIKNTAGLVKFASDNQLL
ncbi:MAG: response regulator [bacterium]|jgi:DNA-binding NarL/FixJ family response regulator